MESETTEGARIIWLILKVFVGVLVLVIGTYGAYRARKRWHRSQDNRTSWD